MVCAAVLEHVSLGAIDAGFVLCKRASRANPPFSGKRRVLHVPLPQVRRNQQTSKDMSCTIFTSQLCSTTLRISQR